MKCLYCDSDDHPWFNCRKKPEGWKPPKIGPSSAPALEQALHHSRTDAARAKHLGDDEEQGVRGAGVPAKSTAARMDVRLKAGASPKTSPGDVSERAPSVAEAGSPSANQAKAAGTQAPPVDTYPRIEGAKFVANVPEGTQLLRYGNRVLAAGPGLAPSIVTVDGLVPLTVPLSELKMGGRPKTMTAEERRAYKRVKEQERRDGLKRAEQGE